VLRKDGVPILHHAARDGNAEIIVWHLAALEGNLQILKKLLQFANEKLTTEEVNNKLLLTIYPREHTIWHVAEDESNTDMFQEMWE